MRHIGTQPKWVKMNGSVQYPENISKQYNEILNSAIDSYEKDFAILLHSGKYLMTPMVVQPRGLTNQGLMCFANASIQLLFASPPFVSFASFMRTNFPLFSEKQKAIIPSWNALCRFFNAFKFSDASNFGGEFTSLKSLDLIEKVSATNTKVLDDVFGRFSSKRKPRQQEDASEFLAFFLNKLHDELITLIDLYPIDDSDKDGWLLNGKIPIIDTQGKISPLSRIFASFVNSQTLSNHKPRSVNAEVNLVLQLPVQGISNIYQALRKYVEEEQITDEISKKNTFTALPMSLIIGLTRFGYNEYGPIKLTGIVEYPEILKMENFLESEKEIHYQLSAVVVHIGTHPSAGHYICIARRFDGKWMKFDDDKVSDLGEEAHLDLQAYMLLYNRIN